MPFFRYFLLFNSFGILFYTFNVHVYIQISTKRSKITDNMGEVLYFHKRNFK